MMPDHTTRPPRALRFLALPLIGTAILTQSFIDLEFRLNWRGDLVNLPVADLCAVLLLALGSLSIWKDALNNHTPPLPGIRGYVIFLLASVLSIWVAMEPLESLHHVIRKPLFFYLAYGVGFSWWISRGVHTKFLNWTLMTWAVGCATISLITSATRISTGDALWHHAIEGLSPNHKAITVALSGALPLLLSFELRSRSERILRHLVLALAGIAILFSASKTAILTGLIGVGLCWPRARPLSFRPRLLVCTLGVGVVLAYYAPVLVGSKTMLDAARSRHSLNERALEMFAHNPLIGSGSGMSVHYEQIIWPHYRVNGVDTHGVIQKVSAETGLLGLAGYGIFAGSTGLALLRRRREEDDVATHAALGTWITLHANLLLSTESLSPTHWLPFAVAWGIAHRISPQSHANIDGSYLPPPPRR